MAQNNRNGGRSFASTDPDRQREVAGEGGRTSHQNRRPNDGEQEEPAEGGHLGGLAAHHHSSAA
jgi:general stress protein YciG